MSGPDFGPGGYLPPKASKRARKIVLREQMGTGWPLAALAASVLVLVAGGVFLLTASRAPSDPYVEMQPLTEVPAGGAATIETADGAFAVLAVRTGGSLHAFLPEPGPIRWCAESGRLETDDAAWLPDGRLVYGDRRMSLAPLRTVVHDGVIYVDLSTQLPPPPEESDGEPPVCTQP